MKKPTVIAIAGAAAIASLVAVWLGSSSAPGPAPKPTALFPGLLERVNDVAEIKIDGKAGALTLRRAEGEAENWLMVEKGGYPAKFDVVKRALLGMAELRGLEPRTANPELHARLQLEDRSASGSQSTLLSLNGKDGKAIVELLVGKTDRAATETKHGNYYVRKAGDAQTWFAQGQLQVDVSLNRWIDAKVVEIQRKRIKSIDIRQASGARLEILRKAGADEEFEIKGLKADQKLATPSSPNTMAAALDYMPFDDVLPLKEREALAVAVTSVYTTDDGMVLTLKSRKDGDKWWIAVGIEADPANPPKDDVAKEIAELSAKVGPWAYQMPDYRVEQFTKSLDQLLEKDAKKNG